MGFLPRSAGWIAGFVSTCGLCVACGGSSFQAADGGGGAANGAAGTGLAGGGGSHMSGGDAGSSANGGGGAASSASGSAGEAGADTGPDNSAYRALILADGPLVYWRMGAVSSRTVADETGGGNDLVLQGSGHMLGVDGAIVNDDDGAIGFDGAASFAIASDARALDFTADAAFTLECWAKRSAGGASYFQHLLSNVQGSAGDRDGYALYLLPAPSAGDSARSVFEYDLPAADLGVWGPLPNEGEWAHYAAVYDGARATLYVDGTLADSSVVAASVLGRTGPFAVGRASDTSGSFFKGALDEIAVYPRALSVAEIARHYSFAK